MKLFPDGSLARCAADPNRDPQEAVQVVATLARAVEHAHRHGILHCDLKPGNILLDENGQPHIADFGLARHPGAESGSALATAIVGTPLYMAPEQAAGSKDLTAAVDVHGLGVILFELLTGRPPFAGVSVLETLHRVAELEADSPRRLNRRVDSRLETICLKCLGKSPANRYPSAEALAKDLDCWLAGQPIAARPEGRLKRIRRRLAGRRRLLATLALLVVVLGTAAAEWRLWLAPALVRDDPAVYEEDVKQAWRWVQAGNFGAARKLRDKHREATFRPIYDWKQTLFAWDARKNRETDPGVTWTKPRTPPDQGELVFFYSWRQLDAACRGHVCTIGQRDVTGRVAIGLRWSADSQRLFCLQGRGLPVRGGTVPGVVQWVQVTETVVDANTGQVISVSAVPDGQKVAIDSDRWSRRDASPPIVSPDGQKVALDLGNGLVNVWETSSTSRYGPHPN
jgi:hypothetical protein